jgi:hypothetical protein
MDLNQFELKEYEKLQNEISQTLAEIGTLERFAITTSGGLFAWIFTDDAFNDYPKSCFLPALLVFLFGLIALGHFLRLGKIGRYIITYYEEPLTLEGTQTTTIGWEKHLKASLKNWGSLIFYARYFMWLLLLAVNVGIAYYLYNK